MLSRAKSAIWLLSAAFVLAAAPYKITLDGPSAGLSSQTALADNGGGGGGNAGGGGGNAGGSGGNPGGDNGGNSGGNAGGNSGGNAGGNSGGKGGGGRGGNAHVNRSGGDRIAIRGSAIEVRHANGMKEKIGNGRYEMTDARGRTIINRPANGSDRARLRAMID